AAGHGVQTVARQGWVGGHPHPHGHGRERYRCSRRLGRKCGSFRWPLPRFTERFGSECSLSFPTRASLSEDQERMRPPIARSAPPTSVMPPRISVLVLRSGFCERRNIADGSESTGIYLSI